jgi:hypothetical protein
VLSTAYLRFCNLTNAALSLHGRCPVLSGQVTSLGARGGPNGAMEAVEEEDAQTAASAAGSGGMFPGLQPSARGAFELNGGHKLRAAMRGLPIDTQVGATFPRIGEWMRLRDCGVVHATEEVTHIPLSRL